LVQTFAVVKNYFCIDLTHATLKVLQAPQSRRFDTCSRLVTAGMRESSPFLIFFI